MASLARHLHTERCSRDESHIENHFADGLTEEVIIALSKVRSLRVPSRTTVMPYRDRTGAPRDIAREPGVSHLLQGSVRKAGNRLRVSASLLDAALHHAHTIEVLSPGAAFAAGVQGVRVVEPLAPRRRLWATIGGPSHGGVGVVPRRDVLAASLRARGVIGCVGTELGRGFARQEGLPR